MTRNQVVDVAYGLIGDEGPAGLSMRKLAGALHVSLPTVYTAIDSREVLVDELQDRVIDEVAGVLGLGAGPAAASTTLTTERGRSGTAGAATGGGERPGIPEGGADEAGTGAGTSWRERGRRLLDWSRRRPQLVQFVLLEPPGAMLAERTVLSAGGDRRAASAALLHEVVGDPTAGRLDPVVAVALVLAEARAALWLAGQERLAAVDATVWFDLACENSAEALRRLAGA